MRRYAIRIEVPDRPGTLSAVASLIAQAQGNVAGFEVLEHDGTMAFDEFLVELEDGGDIDALCDGLRSVDGTGIELVRPVAAEAEERGLQVISAAVAILDTAIPSAALSTIVGSMAPLFDLSWSALVNTTSGIYVQCHGDVPPIDGLLSLIEDRHSSPDTNGVVRSEGGILVGDIEQAGLVLCIGREAPFRGRERREFEMLVRVTDRMCRSAQHDRIPVGWGPQPRFMGRW